MSNPNRRLERVPQLTSAQRKRLRGLAHDLRPLVQIGKSGLTEGVSAEIDRALDDHELIKVRFLAGKETKEALVGEIVARLRCGEAGRIGHVSILYRQQRDPEKRKIHLEPE